MTDWYYNILYPDQDKKGKLPLWVHYLGRFSLILANIYLVYWLWFNFHYFFMYASIVILFYQVGILFYGEEVREFLRDILTKI